MDLMGGGAIGGGAFGGGNAPDYRAAQLDPGTKKLIQDSINRGTASDQKLSAELNQGVGSAQLGQSDQGLKQEAAASGQNPAVLSAIRNQYNQAAGKSIQGLVEKNNLNMGMVRNQRLQMAAQAAMAKMGVETMNYEKLQEANMTAEMARGQALTGILQMGGMVGGAAMGGGMGGGMMGGGQKQQSHSGYGASGFSSDQMDRESYMQSQFSGGR